MNIEQSFHKKRRVYPEMVPEIEPEPLKKNYPEQYYFNEEMLNIRECPCYYCAYKKWKTTMEEKHGILLREKRVHISISCTIASYNRSCDNLIEENRVLEKSLIDKENNSFEYNEIILKMEENLILLSELKDELNIIVEKHREYNSKV
jgi:hypothetical protein